MTGTTGRGRGPENGIDWAVMHARVRAAIDGMQAGFEPDAAEIDRRLRERAARLARPQEGVAAADDLRLLGFTLNGCRHAVDSALVREVCADLTPTPVPNVPAWVAGIVHLRGEMLTVIDFRVLSGIAAGPEMGEGMVLVLNQGDRALGLAVDAVGSLRAVARDGLGPVPATVHDGRRYYLGVAEDGDLVLDGTAFFDDGGLPGLHDRAAGVEG